METHLPDRLETSDFACLGRARPGWSVYPEGEDSGHIGMIDPGYAPESSWDGNVARRLPRVPPKGAMLSPERFTQHQCNRHWRPLPPFEEFARLFELKVTERPRRLHEIRAQHHGSASRFRMPEPFLPFIAQARSKCGGDGSKGDAWEVVGLLQAAGLEIEWVILAQKCLYNRVRPFQVFPELDPPFCPAHPSFPSGHATQAYALAFFLDAAMGSAGEAHRAERDAVLAAAKDIAENREVAGAHFPSDTAAGKALADMLVKELLAHPRMAEALERMYRLFTPA